MKSASMIKLAQSVKVGTTQALLFDSKKYLITIEGVYVRIVDKKTMDHANTSLFNVAYWLDEVQDDSHPKGA